MSPARFQPGDQSSGDELIDILNKAFLVLFAIPHLALLNIAQFDKYHEGHKCSFSRSPNGWSNATKGSDSTEVKQSSLGLEISTIEFCGDIGIFIFTVNKSRLNYLFYIIYRP